MKIFVGCSSQDEIPEVYLNLAQNVGKILQNFSVVIGGTCEGMMGRVAKEIPIEQLTQIVLKDYWQEEESSNSSHYLLCDTSFERMNQIWNTADCFLILPGGTGTLGELLSFLEENRTKEKKKKILVMNEQNYFGDVLTFIEKAKSLKFSNETVLDGLLVFDHFSELKQYIMEEL